MPDQYTATVAAHYEAYRPPLHQRILKRALSDAGDFPVGLDVGCGTGRSSVALAEFCGRVFAIDPSPSMLDAAAPHEAITYLQGAAEQIPLPDRSVDLATFAGSLSYANRDATAGELSRVCKDDARVVAYDFAILIDDVLPPLGIASHTNDRSYDHRANLSGVPAFDELLAKQERMQLEIRTTDLAHILLADSVWHDTLVERYKTVNPLDDLAVELESIRRSAMMAADIFYSVYQIAVPRTR